MNSTIVAFKVLKPVGVRGDMKVTSFIDISKISQYAPFFDTQNNKINLKFVRFVSDHSAIIQLDNVKTMDEAETWRNKEILFLRDKLTKLEEGNFYVNDMLGASVTFNGDEIGQVLSVDNFGSNDLLNIKLNDGNEVYVPFNKECFPDDNSLSISEFGYQSYVLI